MSLSITPLIPDATNGARDEIKLMIQDDGVGYSSERGSSEHMGIGFMRERAASIQASLSLESQPGYGTKMTLIWCRESENTV